MPTAFALVFTLDLHHGMLLAFLALGRERRVPRFLKQAQEAHDLFNCDWCYAASREGKRCLSKDKGMGAGGDRDLEPESLNSQGGRAVGGEDLELERGVLVTP